MKFKTKEDRDKFIIDGMRLVNHVVYHKLKIYRPTEYTMEDYMSIGSIGLIKAVDKFDENRGVKFSTFAIPIIEREIFRIFRYSNNGIMYGGKILSNKNKVEKMRNQNKDYKEIAIKLNLTEKDVIEIAHINLELNSLNRKSELDDDLEYIDLIQEVADKIDDDLIVNDMLKILNERDKQIVTKFIIEDIPQYEIAKEFGITQQGVNYIVQQSLNKLREVA